MFQIPRPADALQPHAGCGYTRTAARARAGSRPRRQRRGNPLSSQAQVKKRPHFPMTVNGGVSNCCFTPYMCSALHGFQTKNKKNELGLEGGVPRLIVATLALLGRSSLRGEREHDGLPCGDAGRGEGSSLCRISTS